MTSTGARGRLRQAYLLFGTRVACQSTRLAWAPLLVYISKELNLNHAKQGQVLSSFSFGYLFTQVLGGMAADRYGGKPVQTMSLVGSALGMLLVPVVVDYGFSALCMIYFVMGLCQGPQHPGYNAMAAIWFRAAERGWVSSVCEAGPVTGTLLALLIAPRLAATYGWRTAFTTFGMLATIWSIIWQHFAHSNPSELPRSDQQKDEADQEEGAGTDLIIRKTVSQITKQLSTGSNSQLKHHKMSNPAANRETPKSGPIVPDSPSEAVKTVARGPTKFPWTFFTFVPVWGVIGQHMIFNTTRYFFADYTAIYYNERFGRRPETSGLLLTLPFATGAVIQMLISGVEEPLIKQGITPLQVRKLMGSLGFSITAVGLFLMTTTYNEYMFCFWLSVIEGSLACHACGYKANYMDLTTRHQGIFMGTGNTIASVCTFGMPLLVANVLDTFHEWNGIFLGLMCVNFLAVFINQRLTVVKELHVAEV
mmetsp:Transcript_8442/g.20755  ORF Transcript_8442/g.20755 Transcript_8442/m.20755 type:complete len:479 (-) Transcript_8442:221-1657(-)|eukprot:CAMPEP_0114509298 /NCGR_PEP_ID=MMETSP0109-20121206/13126_1 /TAXON_ID=29199 /ORGANISM="Chlorarachnion reptans, Strain CCCM449" /LENGTH=478 /DNA_ID=CAMNT_0001688423 /DNA_START=111 /DNA_END=1547 /DNA_ORIENTATION=-